MRCGSPAGRLLFEGTMPRPGITCGCADGEACPLCQPNDFTPGERRRHVLRVAEDRLQQAQQLLELIQLGDSDLGQGLVRLRRHLHFRVQWATTPAPGVRP